MGPASPVNQSSWSRLSSQPFGTQKAAAPPLSFVLTLRSHSESGRVPSLLIVLGQFQPGDDVHGLQLLEEQLAGVWDAERGHVARRLAVVAPETQVSMHQRGGN